MNNVPHIYIIIYNLLIDRCQLDRQIDRQTDRQTDTQTHRHTDRQTDGQTDRQIDGKARKIDRYIDTVCTSEGYICNNHSYLP